MCFRNAHAFDRIALWTEVAIETMEKSESKGREQEKGGRGTDISFDERWGSWCVIFYGFADSRVLYRICRKALHYFKAAKMRRSH